MACSYGTASLCNKQAGTCAFKTLNESLGYVDVELLIGIDGGYEMFWIPGTTPDLFVRTLTRTQGTSGFPYPDSYENEAEGAILVTGLDPGVYVDVYTRLESDTEFGPWLREIAITTPNITPNSKAVAFGDDSVLSINDHVVVG